MGGRGFKPGNVLLFLRICPKLQHFLRIFDWSSTKKSTHPQWGHGLQKSHCRFKIW